MLYCHIYVIDSPNSNPPRMQFEAVLLYDDFVRIRTPDEDSLRDKVGRDSSSDQG
jgi:hypothetical protein